jgi:retinol dehydrogenase-14
VLADFASLDSVRDMAEQIRQRYDRLDALVNNAGAYFLRRQESADGFEMTFAVNHLAPFLLTNLLVDRMQAGAPARIINVASDAHVQATMDFADLQFEQRYPSFGAYGRSKLANILFTYELARRLEGTGVTANAVHPGFVSTGMGSNNAPPWFGKIFRGITSLFARDVVEGAETVIYLADSPEVEEISGKYFVDKTAVSSSAISYDEAIAARLWDLSAQMVDLPDSR